MWVQLVVAIALAVLQYVLTPKPPGAPQPALKDVKAPTAEEGKPIPVVFGTVTVTGPNVIWFGDLDTKGIKSGGK